TGTVNQGGKDEQEQILKRAVEHGDVDRNTLMAAAQERASKAFPDLSEPVAFAKYVTENPGIIGLMKAAPPAPAAAAAKSSFEILAKGALEHCRKLGTELPPHSPYLPYLKATALEG